MALDSASRGLRTALVEARDFGSGTSSKSSKMVHGGLRYLQQRDYLLVYEALHERQRLLRNAPHLVHPLPFLIPLFGKDGVVSKSLAHAYSVALWLYDLTGGVRIGRRHQRIGVREALSHFPVLRTDRLVAAFLYWDAQADDARLTLALARTAASHGAVLANYAPIEAFLSDRGLIRGAVLAGGTKVRADVVINATGVWAGGWADGTVAIRPAKGVHLAVPADKLPCDYASVLAVPGDRRSIFVVPWAADEADGPSGPGRYTYVGTTDTDYEGPLENPQCTPEDIEYLLSAVNAWTSADLTPEDVTGTWAGLRPLIRDAGSARTADLSRRHRVSVSDRGLITVTGGKLTTYRKMAAETVDSAVKVLPSSGRKRPSSQTGRLPLVGASPVPDSVGADSGLTASQVAHLVGRHGSEIAALLELCQHDPALTEPLVPGLPYLKVEAVYAVKHEMARTLSDVLARRTRASILDREASASAAPGIAAMLAPLLGWDSAEQGRQLAGFLTEIEIERLSISGAVRPVA